VTPDGESEPHRTDISGGVSAVELASKLLAGDGKGKDDEADEQADSSAPVKEAATAASSLAAEGEPSGVCHSHPKRKRGFCLDDCALEDAAMSRRETAMNTFFESLSRARSSAWTFARNARYLHSRWSHAISEGQGSISRVAEQLMDEFSHQDLTGKLAIGETLASIGFLGMCAATMAAFALGQVVELPRRALGLGNYGAARFTFNDFSHATLAPP